MKTPSPSLKCHTLAGWLLLALFIPAGLNAQDCFPAPIHKTLGIRMVQEALRDAWNDSLQGTPKEHEEGGWVIQCIGEFRPGVPGYKLFIERWPPGDHDSIRAGPTGMGPECRIIASFHTHPGPHPSHPDWDGYQNHRPSPADLENAERRGVPGIIVYGTGTNFNSIDNKVITYGPTEPRVSCEDLGFSQARVWGDPHLATLDGLFYSLQAAGEFVAVTNDRDLEMQLRFEPPGTSTKVTTISAAAIRMGEHVVMFARDGIRLDGAIVESLPGQLGEVAVSTSSKLGELRFDWPNGTVLTVLPGHFIRTTLTTGVRGEWRGLLGNNDGDPDNDLIGRSGPITNINYHTLYKELAPAWAVTDDTSLFTYAPGTSTATFVDPDFPSEYTQPSDLKKEELDAARDACRAVGVWLDPFLSECAFDYAMTGDKRMLDLAADAFDSLHDRTEIDLDQPEVVFEGAVETIGGGTMLKVNGTPGEQLSVSLDELCGVTNAAYGVVDFTGIAFDDKGQALEEFWIGGYGCISYGPWTFPESGVLSIGILSRKNNVDMDLQRTGTFKLTLGKLSERTEDLVLAAGKSASVTNRIDVRLGSLTYCVQAPPDSLLSVYTTSLNGEAYCERGTYNLKINAATPAGDEVGSAWPGNSGCMACGPWKVPGSGRLDVTVITADGNLIGAPATGPFELEFSSLPEPEPIALQTNAEQTVKGEITMPLERKIYRLQAEPGTKMEIEVTSMGEACTRNTWNLKLDVMDNGQTLIRSLWPANDGCKAYGPFVVPPSGTLLLSPHGGDGKVIKAPPTGAYEFVVRKQP